MLRVFVAPQCNMDAAQIGQNGGSLTWGSRQYLRAPRTIQIIHMNVLLSHKNKNYLRLSKTTVYIRSDYDTPKEIDFVVAKAVRTGC